MAATNGPADVAHGVQQGAEPQQRVNGDAAASRSLAGQHLMAVLQQRLAASSGVPGMPDLAVLGPQAMLWEVFHYTCRLP